MSETTVQKAPALGHCCYGGVKPKSDCEDCGAWRMVHATDAAAAANVGIDPAQDEGAKAITALSWMDAQGDLKIEEHYLISGVRLVQILDGDDTMIGQGEDLLSALADAMGGA